MGKRHALNFLERTPRADLVAASSPDDAELEWAKVHLAPFGVKLYKNYDDMLKHEGLEAVVVASATAVHAEQTIKAIEANKHVLCEKPLSTSVEIVGFFFFFFFFFFLFSCSLLLLQPPADADAASRKRSSMQPPESLSSR